MFIFEFIKILNNEKFPFELIPGPEWFNSIIVKVDTFSNIEEYEFTVDGIYRYTKFTELSEITVDKPHNKEKILNHLHTLNDRPRKAWQKAAKDLGIIFITPYSIKGANGEEFEVTGLLPEFGFGKGVLITSRKTNDDARVLANFSKKYLMTGLNPRYYDSYERDAFIKTLSDWEWIGKGNPPKWLLPKDK